MSGFTTIPDELTSRITNDEGLRMVPYRDEAGNETLGIGHKLTTPISIRACNLILDDDILMAQKGLAAALPWTSALDPVRYWTCVELAFNMGMGVVGGEHGLLSFAHFLDALQRGFYVNAAAGLLQSKWAESDVSQERSQRISKQIKTGVWS